MISDLKNSCLYPHIIIGVLWGVGTRIFKIQDCLIIEIAKTKFQKEVFLQHPLITLQGGDGVPQILFHPNFVGRRERKRRRRKNALRVATTFTCNAQGQCTQLAGTNYFGETIMNNGWHEPEQLLDMTKGLRLVLADRQYLSSFQLLFYIQVTAFTGFTQLFAITNT
jgi:hypothetical protein